MFCESRRLKASRAHRQKAINSRPPQKQRLDSLQASERARTQRENKYKKAINFPQSYFWITHTSAHHITGIYIDTEACVCEILYIETFSIAKVSVGRGREKKNRSPLKFSLFRDARAAYPTRMQPAASIHIHDLGTRKVINKERMGRCAEPSGHKNTTQKIKYNSGQRRFAFDIWMIYSLRRWPYTRRRDLPRAHKRPDAKVISIMRPRGGIRFLQVVLLNNSTPKKVKNHPAAQGKFLFWFYLFNMKRILAFDINHNPLSLQSFNEIKYKPIWQLVDKILN